MRCQLAGNHSLGLYAKTWRPQSTPRKIRPVPALRAPRPRSTLVPPGPPTVAKMAKWYMPATDDVTPAISPARAEARPASPAPVQRPGRGRGRGWWRTQSRETPGVGTRSKTRQAEAAATQALVTRAMWPEKPDKSLAITRMTRDLRLQDPPEDRLRIDDNQNEARPPAAGFHSHHRDV